tara:strand:- start:626790 stop:627530 length:741 start_codon:yes stop_codon:yes gene_type:complete
VTGIIVQARKGSSRLPNKMVLPFYEEKGVLELLFEKLTTLYPKDKIILATTTNPLDDELETIANKFEVSCFRGDENNVLQRFIEAAEHYQFTHVIRVCADNPFLDIEHISIIINEIETNELDYVSYKTSNGLPTIKSHLGLFTEAVTLQALKKVEKYTTLSLYQEHVTNFIYENKELFKIKLLKLPIQLDNCENIRLTLDTLEDFKLEQELFNVTQSMNTVSLLEYIKSKENLLDKMQIEILKNTK